MSAPPLSADLEAGLRRLRLRAIREMAPEVLLTAKTQRWAPELLLATLVESEIEARERSNAQNRLRQASFPVRKTLDEFDLSISSIKRQTFDYLSSLEWIGKKENFVMLGPAGTGKSHMLIALGHHAVEQGKRVRYFTAAELVETLYRGLADNSVGELIDNLLRFDLLIVDEVGFAPLDETGTQLFFRLVAGAYERRALGVGSHFGFDKWGHFLPEHTTAASLLDRLIHHATVVVTSGESYRMREAREKGGARKS